MLSLAGRAGYQPLKRFSNPPKARVGKGGNVSQAFVTAKASKLEYQPNTVSSMSFLAFPKERNGFNQETVECIRSSPMDSSVTYVKDKKNRDVELSGAVPRKTQNCI